jgi:hypothetical protein
MAAEAFKSAVGFAVNAISAAAAAASPAAKIGVDYLTKAIKFAAPLLVPMYAPSGTFHFLRLLDNGRREEIRSLLAPDTQAPAEERATFEEYFGLGMPKDAADGMRSVTEHYLRQYGSALKRPGALPKAEHVSLPHKPANTAAARAAWRPVITDQSATIGKDFRDIAVLLKGSYLDCARKEQIEVIYDHSRGKLTVKQVRATVAIFNSYPKSTAKWSINCNRQVQCKILSSSQLELVVGMSGSEKFVGNTSVRINIQLRLNATAVEIGRVTQKQVQASLKRGRIYFAIASNMMANCRC